MQVGVGLPFRLNDGALILLNRKLVNRNSLKQKNKDLTLAEVLLGHARAKHPDALQDNLGDAFLLNHNPVIATIRTLALDARFNFSSERWSEYDALPLVELPTVLKQRKIPYTDNVSVLKKLERSSPGGHLFKNLPPIKMNPIFHESAHGVAHVLTGFKVGKQTLKSLQQERRFALELLLQESFANATESFANVYSDTLLHDEFFYLNSYVIEQPVHRVAIVRLVQSVGKRRAFQVLMLSFLYANFLKIQGVEQSLRNVCEFLSLEDLSSRDERLALKVFKIGLNLDSEFTEETNAFCLKSLGIHAPLKKLFSFDFLSAIKNDLNLSLAFQRLSKVAESY